MTPDRIYLVLATVCFAASFCYAVACLRAGNYRGSWWNVVAMALGLACQTAFLGMRGAVHHSCPVKGIGEILVFVSWSMVIIYLLVGRTYRLSLMGVFTAPIAFVCCLIGLLMPFDGEAATLAAEARGSADWWTEFHIGISLLAYGAFGMAFVAGMMFLIQERQVKSGNLKTLFYNLPPMQSLSSAVFRLLLVGVVLMAAGIVSAHKIATDDGSHVIWPLYVIWAAYAALVVVALVRGLVPRSLAKGAVVAFLLPLVSLALLSSKK